MTVSKGKLPAKSGMSQDLQDKGKEGGKVGTSLDAVLLKKARGRIGAGKLKVCFQQPLLGIHIGDSSLAVRGRSTVVRVYAENIKAGDIWLGQCVRGDSRDLRALGLAYCLTSDVVSCHPAISATRELW